MCPLARKRQHRKYVGVSSKIWTITVGQGGASRGVSICCQTDHVPDFVRNPYNNSLWNAMPCPPPWNKEIIFKTNWFKHLHYEEGPRIIIEIARRCNFSVPERHQLPGRVSSSLILTSCGVDCRSIIVVTCLILLIAGFTILAYLFHVSERQKKRCLLTREQKKYTDNTCTKKYFEDRKQTFPTTKERITDRSRQDRYQTPEDNGVSSQEHISIKGNCKLNSYGNLPPTPFDDNGTTVKGQGHISDHLYETLSGKNTIKVKFKDGVYNSSLDSPISGDGDYESNGLMGHFYETLEFKDTMLRDMFSAPPEMLDSPLAGNVVRKWEYQSTLNRKAALSKIRTADTQSNNTVVK